MPVNRQQEYQVIPQTGQSVPNAVHSRTAATVARQLEGLLSTGTQGIVSILGNMEQEARVDQRALIAAGNMAAAHQELGAKADLFSVEAATQANQSAATLANEKMQYANMQLKDILDQKERGILAFIAQATPSQLQNLINSGEAQNMDPRGLLKIEEQVGARLATEDTLSALTAIHADPKTAPEDIIKALAGKRPINSHVAMGSYVATLTSDIKRFQAGEVLSLMDQERQKSTENLFVRFQRDIAFDAKDASLTPEKLVSRVKQFQSDYAGLNPRTASELDVFGQTVKALSGVVGSGALGKLNPARLLTLKQGLEGLVKDDPMYMPLYATVMSDIEEQVKRVQASRVASIDNMIKASGGETDLVRAGLSIATAVKTGELTEANAAGLITSLGEQKDKLGDELRADSAIYQTNPNIGLANTPAQDKAIDDSVNAYRAEHRKTDRQGNARDWTLPETATFMYERTGRLTQGFIDKLNGAVAVPLDDKASPLAVQGYADAVATIQTMSDKDPVYVRELVRGKKLDVRLGLLATLNKEVPGFSMTGTAQRLAGVDEGNILEAQAILAGNKFFIRRNDPNAIQQQTGGGSNLDKAISKVVDVNAVVKNAVETAGWDNGYLTWGAKYGSKRAADTFRALYTYNYAQLRQQGVEASQAADHALDLGRKGVADSFKTYDLGLIKDRYLVPSNFPIIAGKDESSARKAMETFSTLWGEQQGQVYANLVRNKQINPSWIMSDYNHVSLNLDDAVVQNNELVVPLNLDDVPMDRTSTASVYRYPLDPIKQKAALDAIRQRMADIMNDGNMMGVGP